MLKRLFHTSKPQLANETIKKPIFDKILIANRGEIACRVMRTANRLGVRTVAVYSDVDKHAMHVKMADEAYFIGQAPSSESYLRQDRILEVAKRSGAQAIHPGYGFLSENPDFAAAVDRNGLVFIGPPASAIISMGSKSASKDIMSKAGVPVVPGYHGSNQDDEHLKKEAGKIGYPVLIKAVKGGGGKGMRIVEKPEDFMVMLESSRREARKSFGDDRVLVEKYLSTPRHVEVQVFCDKLGNAVYLFERDCSVQRRHQKVIEEAPAPHLSEQVRRELGEKAVAAAKAVNYVGAGTVEFIMDSETQQFYFMEMNTRLQVEHPVTEMVTGTDLVQWQLEVASGNRLPKLQHELSLNGHCFEARIYAENPQNNFLPDTGKLLHLRTPTPEQDSIRVETGVREGDEVSVYYDPMIAKLVVWGPDRSTALKKLSRALDAYNVVGPSTNIEFLKALSTHPQFGLGHVETGFIKKHFNDLLPPPSAPDALSLFQAAIGLTLHETHHRHAAPVASSPWDQLNHFRVNHALQRTIKFKLDSDSEKEVEVAIEFTKDHYNLTYKNESGQVIDQLSCVEAETLNCSDDKCEFALSLPTHKISTTMVLEGQDAVHLFSKGTSKTYSYLTRGDSLKATHDHSGAKSGDVKAPMPSKVANILVKQGQKVKQGEPLIILEAMKMEHVMRAASDGIVDSVRYKVGDLVGEGQILVSFQSEDKQ